MICWFELSLYVTVKLSYAVADRHDSVSLYPTSNLSKIEILKAKLNERCLKLLIEPKENTLESITTLSTEV